MEGLTSVMQLYLQHKKAEVRDSTWKRLSSQLKGFCRYLSVQGVTWISDLTPKHLLQWHKKNQENALSLLTQQGYLRAVFGFLNWAYEKGFFLSNPWPKELKVKRHIALPRHVPTQKQMQQFFKRLEKTGSQVKQRAHPLRTQAIAELAYGCALRRGELWGLNLRDISEDTLHIVGKRGDNRLVPLGKKAKEVLWRYIHTEREKDLKGNQSQEALFLSSQGKRLSMVSLGLGLFSPKDFKKGHRLTLHSLRHACATHLLQQGASIRVIQELLGHQRLSTTQIYTRVDTSDLRKVLSRYHPRG